MLVDASSIRNHSVLTSDNKKIGTVINVIMKYNFKFPRAAILVFPPEQNWFEDYVRRNWGKLTIDTIKQVFPAEVPKIVEDVKNKGAEEAEQLWNQYYKDNMSKVQMELQKCYLIPVLAIGEAKPKEKELSLKLNLDQVESKYGYIGEPPVSTKQDVAFFSKPNVAVRDAESLLSMTLNLTAIQSLDAQDSEGDAGTIDDAQLDFEQNAVVNLVVQTSANRLVSAEDFDFASLTCNKPFKSYAELPFP